MYLNETLLEKLFSINKLMVNCIIIKAPTGLHGWLSTLFGGFSLGGFSLAAATFAALASAALVATSAFFGDTAVGCGGGGSAGAFSTCLRESGGGGSVAF